MCDLQRDLSTISFVLKGPPKWGFGVILGVGRRHFLGKYICPQNCAFSDIFGPDLMRRVLELCMGIAICHRQNFGQVWGSPAPLPDVAGKLHCQKAPLWTFSYHMEKS